MAVWGRILVRLPNLLDADLNRWRRDLLNTFDPDSFSLAGPLTEVPYQDLDLVPSHLGGVWFELNLTLTYYDIGSEYADPTPFVSYADWLEAHLPGCRVFYGHDNSDNEIEPFERTRRVALMAHYARFGNEPYLEKRRAWAGRAKARAAQTGSGQSDPSVDSPKIRQLVVTPEIPPYLQSLQILVLAPAGLVASAANSTDQAVKPPSSSAS